MLWAGGALFQTRQTKNCFSRQPVGTAEPSLNHSSPAAARRKLRIKDEKIGKNECAVPCSASVWPYTSMYFYHNSKLDCMCIIFHALTAFPMLREKSHGAFRRQQNSIFPHTRTSLTKPIQHFVCVIALSTKTGTEQEPYTDEQHHICMVCFALVLH